jgi:hypothetical protein
LFGVSSPLISAIRAWESVACARGLVLAALRCSVSDYRLSTRIARPRRYLQEQGQQQEQGARATWELIPVVENAPPYGL